MENDYKKERKIQIVKQVQKYDPTIEDPCEAANFLDNRAWAKNKGWGALGIIFGFVTIPIFIGLFMLPLALIWTLIMYLLKDSRAHELNCYR